MKVEIHKFSAVPPAIFSQWRKWVAEDPELHSPFCHPEFSRAVETASGNVEVAIAHDDESTPYAVLPFQRLHRHTTCSVGGFLSNRSGWISKTSHKANVGDLLEKTGISSYRFHSLPIKDDSQLRFSSLLRTVVHADVSNGFQAYVERKKKLGSNVVAKLAQKERKIAREIGDLRLEVGFSEEAFECLLRWKAEACKTRNVKNILAKKWARDTLHDLAQVESPDFRASFTKMMAGDRLVAVHLGLICHHRMAAWFPAFDREYGQYSPGLLLLLQLIRNCEYWGIDRVDFGNGEFHFKDRFKTGESTMLEGIVDKSPINAFVYHCWLKARDLAKSSSLRPALQSIWNLNRSSGL